MDIITLVLNTQLHAITVVLRSIHIYLYLIHVHSYMLLQVCLHMYIYLIHTCVHTCSFMLSQ